MTASLCNPPVYWQNAARRTLESKPINKLRHRMSARVEDGTNDETSSDERSASRSQTRSSSPALDLTCTKVAVDLQSITAATAAERIPAGLQALTDAWG